VTELEKEQTNIYQTVPKEKDQSMHYTDIKADISTEKEVNLQSSKLNQFFHVIDKLENPIKYFHASNFYFIKVLSYSLALKYDLFEILNNSDKESMTVKEIINKLNWSIDIDKIIDLLDVLFVHGYLERIGVGGEASYSITDYTKKYLLKNSTESVYNICKMQLMLLENFNDFTSKMPKNEITFDYTEFDKDDTIMHAFKEWEKPMKDDFQNFLDNFKSSKNIGKVSNILDISSREGYFTTLIAQNFEKANVIGLYKKEWIRVQKEYEQEIGNFPNNLKFQQGDLFDKQLPKSDIIFVNHVTDLLNGEDAYKIIENAYNALNPGGKLVIVSQLLGDNRDKVNHALIRSILLYNIGIYVQFYTFNETKDCLAKAGYKNIELFKKYDQLDVIIAEK